MATQKPIYSAATNQLQHPVIYLLIILLLVACQPPSTHTEKNVSRDFQQWRHYGGDPGNSHYSALAQINRSNVADLALAWSYSSAKQQAISATSELQINPIIVNGILYGRSPQYNVFALHADTGKELWTRPTDTEPVGLSFMRGLSYWQDVRQQQQRILLTTSHYLLAIDANTGQPISDFGDNGKVDLRAGLGRDINKISVYAPSPGVIFEDLIIIGTAVNETFGAAPGDIRAYNTLTGELVWRFHTLPHEGEFGYDSWPIDHWQTGGGANAWAGLSVDHARAVVYAPTGSATPDFNGSTRKGDNLFANTILALDARSGERRWHYQTVHHDLWDRDLSSAPTLATISDQGKQQDVVVQASKQGVLYLLDRDSGKPIFPIAEVPTPASPIPGEYASPTQPQVTLPEPFTRQAFTPDMITDINPEAHAYVKAQYDAATPFAYFRPPGLQPSILFPGFYGGANWGGGAYDPETNLYYINAMEDANLINMVALELANDNHSDQGQLIFKQHCSGCHGDQLQGFYPYAPALSDISLTGNKSEAMAIVQSGKGRMMPFNYLSNNEQSQVVDYLFSLSKSLLLPPSSKTSNPIEPASTNDNTPTTPTETAYVFGGYSPFVDQRYYPAVKPPWGTLNAINLATGKRQWQVTLGEYAELIAEGIAPTGTRNYGGPVVTAGGLLIIAASSDEKLRIFDKSTGELLWQYQLPNAGYATPSTYEINGIQYIVISCGGGKLGTAAGDQYLAFAIPHSSE
ncbi:MAG: PQQ-binding-like beta-propeller repeat protein [Pseudomonadales bacterium]|nr:PQQ-binding-like beta-propeller repeat protein [Pseudomonadales bacterium]